MGKKEASAMKIENRAHSRSYVNTRATLVSRSWKPVASAAEETEYRVPGTVPHSIGVVCPWRNTFTGIIR